MALTFLFWTLAFLVRVQGYLIVGSICSSLTPHDAEGLFMYLLAICLSQARDVFPSFAHLKIKLVAFSQTIFFKKIFCIFLLWGGGEGT